MDNFGNADMVKLSDIRVDFKLHCPKCGQVWTGIASFSLGSINGEKL